MIRPGGQSGGEVGRGGQSRLVELLPNIPAKLIYYEGDHEFPSDVRLLFYKTATYYLELEFLAVLATTFVEAIIKKGSQPPEGVVGNPAASG